jgi:hypothetical protein
MGTANEVGSNRMATQVVLDQTGDSRHNFDPSDMGASAEAERRFNELTSIGFTAAVRIASGEIEVRRAFDPTANETVFIPRLVGG